MIIKVIGCKIRKYLNKVIYLVFGGIFQRELFGNKKP